MSHRDRGQGATTPSLGGVHGSVAVPKQLSFWRRLFAFSGPAYLVSVGYMDPGNWATDIAAGSKFGYALHLGPADVQPDGDPAPEPLGAARHRRRAWTSRRRAGRCSTGASRGCCGCSREVAIAACDLAEVLGSAIGLQLLFGLPLLVGVLITAFDTLLLLVLHSLAACA